MLLSDWLKDPTIIDRVVCVCVCGGGGGGGGGAAVHTNPTGRARLHATRTKHIQSWRRPMTRQI